MNDRNDTLITEALPEDGFPPTAAPENAPDTGTPEAVSGEPSEQPAAPRIRWAAIVWGLFLASLAGGGIWLLADESRHGGLVDWAADLEAGTITALVLLAVGALVLIAGLVGLIRRGQKRLARRG